MCIIASLSACNPKVEPALSVDPQSVSFTEDGGTQTIHVTANTSWTATVSGAILMLSTTAGDGDATVTVTAPPAYKPEETEGIITFSCGGLTAKVETIQAAQPAIDLGETSTIPWEGGYCPVPISYNKDYSVVIDPACEGWVSLVQTRAISSGTLDFKFGVNESAVPRFGKVTVKDAAGKLDPGQMVIFSNSI